MFELGFEGEWEEREKEIKLERIRFEGLIREFWMEIF